ncbi:MAG: DEAD/DEAH box helicase [Verrucomicrobia bacterium]|nr:DEAD/DEAH box helicase [Verrucomicrobiota bacterium]
MPSRLRPEIARWFAQKFGTFTDAQLRCIPAILEGRSVLLSSPTGSGKTLAGFLGIIDTLAREAAEGRKWSGIQALYVSPLRALAYDIEKNLSGPLRELGLEKTITVGLRTGDTAASERARQRRRPPAILITTPESIAILLCSATFRAAVAQSRFVLLDELHALGENKRGVHLTVSLERIEALRAAAGHPSPLCRVGLSATVTPLELMAEFLCGPGRPCLLAEAQAERLLRVEVFSPIRRKPYPPAGHTAVRVLGELAQLIERQRSVLIFCNTRGTAEALGIQLKHALPQLADRIETHHSSIDRSLRLEVEDRLKRGELRAVVCSTSLEMGIDIGAIDLVVMISAPKGVSRALQRIGRSGHSIHQTSHGVLVASNVSDLVECTVTARLVRQRRLDPVRIQEKPYDVVAQHLLGLAIEGPVSPDDAFALIRRAWPFRGLERSEFDRIQRFLEGGGASLERQYRDDFGKLRLDETGRLVPTNRRVERDYLVNIGTIVADELVSVVKGRRRLGTVEESFVKRLRKGDRFVLAGQVVKVEDVGLQQVKVVEARGLPPTVPRWNAQKMPLASGLAAEVVRLRTELDARLEQGPPTEATDWLVEHWDMSLANAQAVVGHFLAQRRISLVPRAGLFLVEVRRERGTELTDYFFHALIGRSANDALSRLVAWRIQEAVGGNALVTIDDYGFLVTVKRSQELPLFDLRQCFRREDAESALAHGLQDSELVRWQFRGVAQTGLMVPRMHPGQPRPTRQIRFSSELLFRVLSEHEPTHPLLEESYRQATHTFLDLPRALAFLDQVQSERWELREVPYVSPFAFPMFVSRIKEAMMFEDPEAAIERLYHEMYGHLPAEGEAADPV